MKPLNLDNKPCSPISSNCVVWQGPDIPCINLCTGDTVSDVVSAMATELCTILDTLKVSNYDLTCFNLQACPPDDFQALIQFLITKICELEGIPAPTKDEPQCPDCVVSVAECFVTGTQTTMQLVDYVQLIGERLCSIVSEISWINSQITDILDRLTDLEKAPAPTFTIPTVDLTECNLSATVTAPGSYEVDLLLGTLINDNTYGYCALIGSTGLPADILSAIAVQEPCIAETTETLSNPPTSYGTEYAGTWVDNPATIADSLTNVWLVLCDIHTKVSSMDIEILNDSVSLTTEVTSIDFTGLGITASSLGGGAIEVNVPNLAGALDTFFCMVAINSTYQPEILTFPATGSDIPRLDDGGTPPLYPPVLTAPRLNQPTIVGYNDQVETATAVPGSFVSQVDVDTLLTGAFCSFDVDDGTLGCRLTINEDGLYLVEAWAYLKPDATSSASWQLGVTTVVTGVDFVTPAVTTTDQPSTGEFGIALIDSDNANVYGGNMVPKVARASKEVAVSFSRTVYLQSGDHTQMAIQNFTDRDYDGSGYAAADIIGFSVTKINDYTP